MGLALLSALNRGCPLNIKWKNLRSTYFDPFIEDELAETLGGFILVSVNPQMTGSLIVMI